MVDRSGPARIVFATAGSAGDLNPFIALSLELKRRGHRPLIATQEEFAGAVRAAGLDFHAVRPGVDDVQAELGLDTPVVVLAAAASDNEIHGLVTAGAKGLVFKESAP